jgi:hypothetical protein
MCVIGEQMTHHHSSQSDGVYFDVENAQGKKRELVVLGVCGLKILTFI